MRHFHRLAAFVALGLVLAACGGSSRASNPAMTSPSASVATSSAPTSAVAATSAIPPIVWTKQPSGPPVYAVWDAVCCNTLPAESPALPTGTDTPTDGFYALTFADWQNAPSDADPEVSLSRFRSCADRAFQNATTSDCLILDQPFSVDHGASVKRTLDLYAATTKVWVIGHVCEGGDVGFTNWTGDGRALRDLEQRFEADYIKWVEPNLPPDKNDVYGTAIPPAVTATGSPFSTATCTAGLEWTEPNGPTLLLQMLGHPSAGQAALLGFLHGRAVDVTAGAHTAYFYAAYQP